MLNQDEMDHTIACDGHQIYCSTQGQGETLVFLHGWPTNSKLWQAQIEVIKKTHRTIAIDWLGFGRSDKPADQHYTFTKSKEILDAVVSALTEVEEEISIVAHDIGGPPAILWSYENQDRVKRLILLNTVIFPFSTPLDQISHTLFAIPLIREAIASPFGLQNLMKGLARSGDRNIGTSIRDILHAHENRTSKTTLKTILEPLKYGKKKEFHQLSKQYGQLTVDRHLIMAKRDPLCYAHIKKLSEENPQVPTYPIDRCGHFIPIDRPAELNAILMQILGKT